MKKYIIITIIAALFFSACNPNEELYKEHDEEIDNSYNDDIEYVFTSSDYQAASNAAMDNAVTSEDSIYAGYIKTFESFNSFYSASDYIPEILADNFLALDNNSTAQVTYNEYNENFNFDENYIGDINFHEFEEADYISLGLGDTAEEDTCFTESDSPDEYLSDFLIGLYPNSDTNTYAKIKYLYPNQETEVEDFYKYDGTIWEQVENFYIITEDDYASMGNPGPGEHNNFSDEYPAENYLIQLLNEKYPYAQDGEFKYIVYDYYSSGASVIAKRFIYNSGWVFYNPAVAVTSQFVHIGTGWIFDPTVRLFIAADDFQLIVDYVNEFIGSEYVSSYGTNEYYTGASAYYGNFDIRVAKRRDKVPQDFPETMTDEDALALVWERLYEGLQILLKLKYPDAVPNVGDFEVHYILTFDAFNDDYAHIFYNVEYKCTASGNPAIFEIVTEATVVE